VSAVRFRSKRKLAIQADVDLLLLQITSMHRQFDSK